MNIGIYGYGNLGRGVENAVSKNPDMTLCAVFTRRKPDTLKIATEGVPVVSADDILSWKDKIDALIICGGSATDLPEMTPSLAEHFNVIDSYDNHSQIPVHFANVDKAESQAAYLYGVARKANKHEDADLFVSVHFNAGGGHGCECYTYKGKESAAAVGVCEELSALGFRNRGVKDGSHIYVISKTKMPAVLVEVCFVDSLTDAKNYKRLGSKVAQAITRGILK